MRIGSIVGCHNRVNSTRKRTGEKDSWKVQSLMGHKDLRATAVYAEELPLEEKKQLLDES